MRAFAQECAEPRPPMNVDSPTPAPQKARSQICFILTLIVSVLLAVPLNVLLLLTLFFASGKFHGRWGWLALAILSTLISVVFFALLWSFGIGLCMVCQKRRGATFCTRRYVFVLIFFLSTLILTEGWLNVCIPAEAIFPVGMSDALAENALGNECDLSRRWLEAQAFFASSGIDFSTVRIVVGGIPKNVRSAPAMVIDNTIYLDGDCTKTQLLVHELTHVWQFQTGWWFDDGGRKFWQWMISQMADRMGSYDYGDKAGLQHALQQDPSARITEAFGSEQQATIVEYYFVYSKILSLLREPGAAWIKYRLEEMGVELTDGVLTVLREVLSVHGENGNLRYWIYEVLRTKHHSLLEVFALQVLQVDGKFGNISGSISSPEWLQLKEETDRVQRAPSLDLGPARLHAGEALHDAFARFSDPADELRGWTQAKQRLGGHEGIVIERFRDKTVTMAFHINGTEVLYVFPNEAIDVVLTTTSSSST